MQTIKRQVRLPLATVLLFMAATGNGHASETISGTADLILRHGKVWTVDASQPSASAIAIRDGRIVAVGGDEEVLKARGEKTQVIDLEGKLVLPGFVDAHTHFENAVGWFFEARIIDVNDEATLLERIGEVTQRVPKGMWITGRDWGGRAAARAKRNGETDFTPLTPLLEDVDRVAPDHPVLLHRYDGSYFINSKGMEFVRITRNSPDPANGEYVRDAQTGELTGMMLGSAGARVALMLPPKSRAADLIAARALMRELNSQGITGIHDISRVESVSQRHIYRTHVERSASDVSLFSDLLARDELTVRVYPILTLANASDYADYGITPSTGNDMIRYGALKAFVDGFYMEEPYLDNPEYAGGLTFRVVDEKSMASDIRTGDQLGYDIAVHVIGDKAHRLLLDWYEAAIGANPPRDRRFRLIHAWFPSEADLDRAARMGMVVDITPYHLIREMHSLDRRLGEQRARTAFAWRSMIDKGLRLSIVSDWPGSFDRNAIAPVNPFLNMYLALARKMPDTSESWHPEQAITIDEAIRAYTINPAFAAREESLKGSITPGKLADLVVLSQDIRTVPVEKLPETRVLYTFLAGRIVHAEEPR